MKIKKERKPFKREYVPIVLAVIILFVLVGGLIYIIGHDFKFEEETVDPNQAVQEELLIDNSNSKCSKDELNELYELAEKITINTEMVDIFYETTMNDETGEPEDIYTSVAQFTMSNVDEKLYFYVTNDSNDEKQEYKPENNQIQFNGVVSFDIVTYTVEVRSNEYDCSGETIRKFTLKTKIFNRFSYMNDCEDYPDYKYCQEYIDEEVPSLQTFLSELEKYKKTTKTTTTTKVGETTKTEENKGETTEDSETTTNYKYYIIGGVAVVLLIVIIAAVILVKKKRSIKQ